VAKLKEVIITPEIFEIFQARTCENALKESLNDYVNGIAVFKNQDLSRKDFSYLNLRGSKFIEVDLSGSNMTWCNLRDVEIINSNMSNTDCSKTNLTNAKLDYSNLENIKLRGALKTNISTVGTILSKELRKLDENKSYDVQPNLPTSTKTFVESLEKDKSERKASITAR
jgi:uncharacterized protein YjbI with pentapeptide repeats